MRGALVLAGGAAAAFLAAAGCSGNRVPGAGGDATRGKQMFVEFGCGACHTIRSVRSARGTVGPPLTGFSQRRYIAGELPNTPANLVRWIVDPPSVEPRTAMPDMNVPESAARDIAAFVRAGPG